MPRVMVRLVFAFLVVLADNNLARAGAIHEAIVAAEEAAKAAQAAKALKTTAEIARATEAAAAARRRSPQIIEFEEPIRIRPLSLIDVPSLIQTSAASNKIGFTYRTSAKSPLNGPDANKALVSLRTSLADHATEVLDKALSEAKDAETGDAYILAITHALPGLTAEYRSKGWSFDASSGDLTIPISIKVGEFAIETGSINLYEISKKVSGVVFGPPSPAPPATAAAQYQASPTKPVSDPLVYDFSKPRIIRRNPGLSLPDSE